LLGRESFLRALQKIEKSDNLVTSLNFAARLKVETGKTGLALRAHACVWNVNYKALFIGFVTISIFFSPYLGFFFIGLLLKSLFMMLVKCSF